MADVPDSKSGACRRPRGSRRPALDLFVAGFSMHLLSSAVQFVVSFLFSVAYCLTGELRLRQAAGRCWFQCHAFGPPELCWSSSATDRRRLSGSRISALAPKLRTQLLISIVDVRSKRVIRVPSTWSSSSLTGSQSSSRTGREVKSYGSHSAKWDIRREFETWSQICVESFPRDGGLGGGRL
jgi:hypothetical protein